MPDETPSASQERTALRLMDFIATQQVNYGVATPISYAPSITYRGRVLWHHLSDAHDVATALARLRHARYRVTPVGVPGWRHMLWKVTEA